MSAQQLELAVLYAYNPPGAGEEAAAVKAQATRYCEEVKGSQDGWRLALELFRVTVRPEARFFCLGCLQDALGARAGARRRVESQHDRFLIREAVMGWLTQVGGGGGAELDAQETFIRTKVAVVLALLVKSDYPETWTDAFEQLRSVLVVGSSSSGDAAAAATGAGGGGRSAAAARAHVELYLRVLCALDEEVVSFHVDRSREEADHNSLIKDTMRVSNAVAQICGVIYEVVAAFETEVPQLAAFALETLQKYIGWIDIAQVVNERFLQLFLGCLRSTDEQLVRRSCSCILEVVNKKMAHPVAKLRVLQQLKLAEMLKQVPLSDEAIAVRVAELVDGVVKQLLSVWDKLEPAALGGEGIGGPGSEIEMMTTAAMTSLTLPPASVQLLSPDANSAPALAATAAECSDMLQEALPMLWACVSHTDVDVAFACSDAIGCLLQTLRRQAQAPKKRCGAAGGGAAGGVMNGGPGGGGGVGRLFRAMDHLPQLLATLYQRMKYPPDFAFDPSDEDEGEEDMLRQQLRKHLVNAIRNAPETVLEFICRALSSLPTPLSGLPFPDLEAALRLIFHFGEGCGGVSVLNSSGGGGGVGGGRRPAAPGAAELLRSGAFPQMVLALHDSDVARHKHPQVVMLYFQLTVRYSKMLADGHPHLIPKVLEAICGPQGLSNADVTLRTRSCYFLTKLVKAMKEGVVPYVDVIVPGVQALLDSPQGNPMDLSDEAKLNLYETIGFLVGMPTVPVPKQVQLLDGVLGPQMRRIAENLQRAAAAGAGGGAGLVGEGEKGGDDAIGAELAAGVGAMANVSKGFKPVVAAEVEARFFQALEAATSALMSFPRHVALRAKTMFLVHGLIPCLGEGLLRALPLSALLVLVQEGDGKDLMEVAQVLNQLTIEYGPKSAQLLDGALMPFIRRTYQLTPGAGSTTAAAAAAAANGGGAQQQAGGEGSDSGGDGWPNGTTAELPAAAAAADGAAATGGGAGAAGAEAQQLLAHEVAERAGFQKLCFSVIQHVSSNGLAGVLSSPTNAPHLDGVLRSVVDGLSGAEDASTKKTCLYIFSLLLGGFNRGRSGGVPAAAAGEGGASANGPAGGAAGGGGAKKGLRAAATQRRALSGKGGGLWTGSGPTVDMEPGVQSAVTAFVCERAVPAALKCLVDGAPPTGLDLRDAAAMSAIVNMGALLKEAREASGGSARFVGVAALACSCTPQVAEQLQLAVEGAADGPAIAAALKAFAQHMRPVR